MLVSNALTSQRLQRSLILAVLTRFNTRCSHYERMLLSYRQAHALARASHPVMQKSVTRLVFHDVTAVAWKISCDVLVSSDACGLWCSETLSAVGLCSLVELGRKNGRDTAW